MHPRTRIPNSRPLLACLALLAGCNLSVDPNLISRGDAGVEPESPVEEEDAGEEDDDDETPAEDASVERDASVELDAHEPVLDAGSDAEPLVGPKLDGEVSDARARDATVPLVDAHVSCGRDDDCASDSYCSAAGVCSAGCDEQRGCAGPVAGREIRGIAAVGDTIYWSTPPDMDALGNPLNHGRIWSWQRTAPLFSAVQHDSGTLLFVSDGYMFLLRPPYLGAEATTLMRKWLGAPDSPAQELATGVRRVWKTRDHVVWTHPAGAGEQLWRMDSASGTVLTLVTVEDQWITSNATFAIKQATYSNASGPHYQLVIIRLSDQSQYGVVELGDWPNQRPAADEDNLYFQRDNQIRRVRFANLEQEIILASGLMPGSALCEPSGGWLYWAGTGISGRTQRDALVPPQALPNAYPFAAVKNDLVYLDFPEKRLLIKTMPPAPCSSTMPCPGDMTCGASMFCE